MVAYVAFTSTKTLILILYLDYHQLNMSQDKKQRLNNTFGGIFAFFEKGQANIMVWTLRKMSWMDTTISKTHKNKNGYILQTNNATIQ